MYNLCIIIIIRIFLNHLFIKIFIVLNARPDVEQNAYNQGGLHIEMKILSMVYNYYYDSGPKISHHYCNYHLLTR